MYLSIMFMLSILLLVVYLYILYTIGFLKFSDLIRLSRPVFVFPYRPPGGMFRVTIKLSVFFAYLALLDKLGFVQKSVRLQNNDFALFFGIFSNTFGVW